MINFDYTVINESKSSNLDKIKGLYNEKLQLLNKLLEEFNNNKNNPNFDFQEHYSNNYASRFASIGGKISGCVRNYKNILMLSILEYLKNEYENSIGYFTLTMYEGLSKVLFDISPTMKGLLTLLNKNNLNSKLQNKKKKFGFHISKMKFDKVLEKEVIEEVKSFFDIQYSDFLKERKKLRKDLISKENEIKIFLKENNNNGE